MIARVFGITALCLALIALGSVQGGEKDAKEVVGKLKAVDLDKDTLTLSIKEGEERIFKITEDTRFVGPQGGKRGNGKKGLRDDALQPDAQVKVVPAADPKTAAEVHLPRRTAKKKN